LLPPWIAVACHRRREGSGRLVRTVARKSGRDVRSPPRERAAAIHGGGKPPHSENKTGQLIAVPFVRLRFAFG